MSALWPWAAAVSAPSVERAPQPASARAAFTSETTWDAVEPPPELGGRGAGDDEPDDPDEPDDLEVPEDDDRDPERDARSVLGAAAT
ncbi:MAG: hypothetical protein LH477_13810, partial [Nocardioides sp.]|nr:hypothetical protein [Nocardioides sp.]